jgi:isoquinoline 1-oxidoreductase subunit beta
MFSNINERSAMNVEQVNTESKSPTSPSRRTFLEGVGTTAFLLAFQLPVSGARAGDSPASPGQFNAFLAIGEDDIVTAIIAQTEGGQGNSTGMTQVIASELGAAWPRMRYRFTTERRAEYINPMLYEGLVLTAGSSSIPGFYDAMRHAAAATREMLVAAAARHLNARADEFSVADSKVIHSPTARHFTFGQLAADAAKEQVPMKPRLRPRSELRLIGQRLDRLDVPAKVNGSARFGLDLEAPGMLYAAVRHGPAHGSTVAQIDDAKARSMPGVRLVAAVPQGVAVVADQYWQAAKALAEVRETYASHPNSEASSATVEAALRRGLEQPGVPTIGSHGDVPAAMKSAAKILEAEFSMPFMSHACMEPVSCTARVGDPVELWLSTKSPSLDAGHAARALGVDPASIVVHNEYQGGDFGRRSGMEHTTEAVLLAKATGRAVKVIWTRQEDLRIDQHRTAFLGRARLGLGADGMPVAYEAKIACDGLWQRLFPWFYAKKKPMDLPALDLVGSSYGIPNEAGTYVNVPLPVRIGAFRGNNDTHNGFMLESMIDDAAREARIDPLDYRRRLLANDARSTAVLNRAAAIAGWGKAAAGHYQGMAFWQSDFYRCRLAVIVEVSGTAGALKVERLVGVCDSGLVINPMLAERAVEAGMIFGLSNAMSERITLLGGAPEQTNFDSYQLLRIDQAPDITVEIISVGDEPGSFGEVGTMPMCSALGNAIVAATGKRIRTTPFGANGVMFI